MTGFLTVNFSDTDEGLFTTREVLELMHVEYDRAKRYDYPASLIVIEVDRLEYLHNLYGWESKEEILQSVIKMLRSITRDSDFLGCMQDDRILAVFPHTDEEVVATIASRLLNSCRNLDFRTDGRLLRATISIGVAGLNHGGNQGFDDFLRAAHEALAYAVSTGGDRFVRRQSATRVISDLRGEIEEEAQRLRKELGEERQLAFEATHQERAPQAEDHHDTVPTPGKLLDPEVDSELADRIHAVFDAGKRAGGDLDQIEREVISLADHMVRHSREEATSRAADEYSRAMNQLERRVLKLKELLDNTEGELVQLAKQKGLDSGIASIYRTVQGLQGGEADGAKKEMLSLIFEANLALQKNSKGTP